MKLIQDISILYVNLFEIYTFNLVNRFCANKPFDRKEVLTFLFAAQPQYLSIETINAQIFCGNIILYIAVYQPFKNVHFLPKNINTKKWERNITKQLLILLQYISTKIYFHHPQFNEFILIFKRDKLEDS